jgi:GAF domain-containing protein
MTTLKISEEDRIARLSELGILDTPHDLMFRSLAEQALEVFPGTSIAAISLVDTDRQWFKSIVGLDVKETPREVSFCSHTIQTDGIMVVEDATADRRFAEIPLVTSSPRVRFYAGVRLMNGVGALCVMGAQPRRPTETELAKLIKLARLVEIQLLSHGTIHNLNKR